MFESCGLNGDAMSEKAGEGGRFVWRLCTAVLRYSRSSLTLHLGSFSIFCLSLFGEFVLGAWGCRSFTGEGEEVPDEGSGHWPMPKRKSVQVGVQLESSIPMVNESVLVLALFLY